MLQLLVINGGAAAAGSESVSPWDGGCVAALSFSVLLLCKYKGTFLLHSQTNAEYFIFCVNLNVPSTRPVALSKSTVECVRFSVQPGERRSVPRHKRRPCLSASFSPPLPQPPLPLLALPLLIGGAHTCGEPLGRSKLSPEAPDRMAADNLFIQGRKMRWGGGGERTLHPSLRPWKPRRCLTTARSLRPPASLTSLKAPENTALPLRLRAFGVQFS